MKYHPLTSSDNWTAQIWPGNPDLNLQCSCKLFDRVPVFIHGNGGAEGYNFTVSAGASSDRSYTGFVKCDNITDAEIELDNRYANGKLFI